jgi:gas vesicle protein
MTERESGIFGVILAFAGGAIAGAATALLLAPMTGDETRDSIKRLAGETKEKVMTKAGEIKLPFGKKDELDLPRNGAV